MIIDEESYLEHYGVKGMQWGVRRYKNVKKQIKNRKPLGSPPRKWKDLSKDEKNATIDLTLASTATIATMAIGAAFVMNHLDSR